MGESTKTVMTLSQGIAVTFNNILIKALTRETMLVDKLGNKNSIITGLFDVAIQDLLQQNTTNEKQIDEIAKSADLIRQRHEPRLKSLYDQMHKTQAISHMLEAELASHYG
jgi:hypothetical protein